MNASELPALLRPADVAELVRCTPATRLLDVRTPGEYESIHIPGAYNVPLDRLGEHADEIRASVTTPVVLVCQSGARGLKAEESLRAAGMSSLHVLEGGVNGWLAAGLPVNRGARRLSLERQVRILAGALAAIGGLLAALVHPLFGLVPAFIGGGLVFAGVTDTCGMAMLLSKLPYNQAATCDVGAMVQALASGSAPVGTSRGGPVSRSPACPAA